MKRAYLIEFANPTHPYNYNRFSVLLFIPLPPQTRPQPLRPRHLHSMTRHEAGMKTRLITKTITCFMLLADIETESI